VKEIRKVLEDIRSSAGMRTKLYYISPIFCAAAYDMYNWLGIRRLRNIKLPGFNMRNKKYSDQLEAVGLEKFIVLGGRFAGMQYDDFGHGSPLIPKVFGTYEAELHSWILESFDRRHDCFINVGCAEGYYAVGFARAIPEIAIYAFDTDGATDSMVLRLATLNKIQSRVKKGRHCSPQEINEIIDLHQTPIDFCRHRRGRG